MIAHHTRNPEERQKSLASSRLFSRYVTGASALLLLRAFGLGLAFIVGAWVARYLGPEQMGVWSYALSITALLSNLSLLGLPQITPHELIRNRISQNNLLGADMLMRFSGACAALFLTLSYVILSGKNLTTCILVGTLGLAYVARSPQTIEAYFQATVRAERGAIAIFLGVLFNAFIKVVFILVEAPLVFFGLSILLDATVVAIALMALYSQSGNQISALRVRYSEVAHLLRRCWPMIFSGVLVMIYLRVDQVMVMEMLGPVDAGQYAVAARVAEMMSFVPVSLASVLFPAIVKAKEYGPQIYRVRLNQFYRIIVGTCIGLAISIYILTPWIILGLFGEAYQYAIPVTRIYCWALIFTAVSVVFQRWLIAEGLEKFLLFRTGLGAALNILLNLILIPWIGIVGAATATLISYAFAGFFSMFFSKSTRSEALNLLTSMTLLYRKSRGDSL